MLQLSILTGTEARREFTLTGDTAVIGRSSTCEVIIPDVFVARQHCRIERQGSVFVLIDLQSTNGTFINDLKTRIKTYTLKNEDVILIGKARIQVRFPAITAEGAMTNPTSAAGDKSTADDRVTKINLSTSTQAQVPAEELTAVRQPDVPIVVTVVSGPDRGMVYSPAQEVFTIGRAPTCDIALHDQRVSRLHASIKREGGQYRLYDENSANGTFHRTPHDRVFHTDLADGDPIYIGQTQLRVEVRSTQQTASNPDDATILSGIVAGKSFSFTLPALGAGVRAPSATTPVPAAAIVEEETQVFLTPGKDESQITLRVLAGTAAGASFVLASGKNHFTVGRSEQAEFCIQDPGISSLHFVVERTPTGFVLTDNDSRNGTFINNNPERVTRVVLQGGEEIRLGTTRLKVDITGKQGGAVSAETKTPEDETAVVASPQAVNESVGPLAKAPQAAVKQPPAVEDVRSRSAAFKERLAIIARQKGITLRPFTMPGSSRHWAALLVMLLAAVSSYGFLKIGRPQFFESGPVVTSHAKWENRCETCHPAWGRKPINATCVVDGCHATVLDAKRNVQDNCTSCHTEHRGRAFNISGRASDSRGDDGRCWSCHKTGMEVRAYETRPLQSYYQQIFALAQEPVPQPGRVTTSVRVQPRGLDSVRQSWLKDSTTIETGQTGLRYGHAIHDDNVWKKSKKRQDCQDCHVTLPEQGVAVFPTHAECIGCHKEVISRDPQVAKTQASKQCLKCHEKEDGGVNRVQRAITYVNFRHDDHSANRCVQCHAVVTTEDTYRPVLRAAALYPVPMNACYACHQERKATLACLGCHRYHHSYPPSTMVASGWLSQIPFSTFLFALVTLVAGASAYTYMDMREKRRWLKSLEARADAKDVDDSEPRGEPGANPATPANAPSPTGEGSVLPFPTVDADTCIACSACYNSCPKKVLAGDVKTHKSTVVNQDACTALEGCSICADTCPTGAIRVTLAPVVKEVERPQINLHNESTIPGMFLVGEVVGAALIKKAINQGDQTIRYIFNQKKRVADVPYDVIIVGAGPGGLAAGLEAQRLGLRYLVLERESIATTIQNYPRDKVASPEPILLSNYGLLPMTEMQKEQLVTLWEEIVRTSGLRVNTREEVTSITKTNNLFTVTSTKGTYQGTYVILAIGTRGNPRKIGVPGEDLPKVLYNLIDAAEWKGKKVLIVGGGDSAIEAAVAIAQEEATTVTLSYRRGEFSRLKSGNAQGIAEQEKAGRVSVIFNSDVTEISEKRVTLKVGEEERELENDVVFALIGADPPKAWLEQIGVKFTIVKETPGAQQY